ANVFSRLPPSRNCVTQLPAVSDHRNLYDAPEKAPIRRRISCRDTAVCDWGQPRYNLIMVRFTKMNGAGNDFVLIDNRAGNVHLNRDQISRLCDRHRGIGADGILLLEKSANRADFRMRYFNADGGEAEMCGNGARCFARFANKVAGAQDKISFETLA